jgi:phage-related protein
MASDIGVKIGVEGDKVFKQSLAEINQAFKVLGSEMQLVTSQFDKNDKSAQALTSRNTVLNKEIEAQKDKIATLKAALDNASASFGESDRRTQNWQIALNKAQAELGGMEKELSANNKALLSNSEQYDALGKEIDDTVEEYVKVKKAYGENSNEAKALEARLKGLTEEQTAAGKAADAEDKEIAEVTKSLGQYEREMGRAAGETEKASSKMEKIGGAFKVVGAAIGAVAVAAGAAAIKLGKEVISAYADYEQLVGGVETLFTDSAQTVQNYAANAFKTAGMSANEYMETVTGFSASLIQSLGGDTAKAAEVADMAITDMADNANKMGSDLSSIQNAYQGFAKGQYNMLDNLKLGYGGTKTEMERLLADAEKFSGIKYDISSYADVAEAIHVIQSEMGITGTTAKEASETISGSIAGMQSAVGNLMAGLGNANADIGLLIGNVVEQFQNVVKNIVPVIENIVKALPPALAGILQAVGDLLPALLATVVDLFTQVLNTILTLLPELIPAAVDAVMTIVGALIDNLPLLLNAAVQLVLSLAQGIGEALPALIPAAIEAVITIVQGLIDNLPLILEASLQLVLGLTQGILDALPTLIEALPAIIIGIVDFIIGAIPQIIDAGIRLLVSLVEALPEIITAIVEAIPQIIDGLINAILGSIPQLIDAGIRLLVSLIENLPTIITTIVQAIPQIISSLVNAIVGNIDKIIMAGVQLFISLIENLPTIIIEVVKAVPQIIKGLIDAFGSFVSSFGEVGLNLIKGLWEGIKNAASWIKDKVCGFFKDVLGGIAGFLGIHSPSTMMRDMFGKNMAKGIGVGFEDEMENVSKAMQDAIPMSLEGPDMDINAGINAALNGVSGSAASGLDIGARLDIMTGLLGQLLEAFNVKVVLNDGTLVGRLAPEIDRNLALLRKRGMVTV